MRLGLVGLGSMGSVHLGNYIKMKEEGEVVNLVAICDIDSAKLKSGASTTGNLKSVQDKFDLSQFSLYEDMEEMIRKENLDFVSLCLPTHLHAPMTIKALELGVNVFCEKPMARSSDECTQMIEAAKRSGKKLMIGHTLRYWPEYVFAKDYIERGVFGKCVGAYFYRGGATPLWSWDNWLMDKERSGGCLLDQHVHDVDTIVWMFGLPKSVSTIGRNVIPGSGYDVVSTNYIYEDGKIVNSQDDWTINGQGYGFKMLFRINFEKGALVFEDGKLMVHPEGGEGTLAKLDGGDAYYDEVILFSKLLQGEDVFDYMALLESHRQTMLLAEAEERSADSGGALQSL